MKVHLITIGDEILIGQIIDTNSAYIAKKLNEIGLEVEEILSIPDDEDFIKQTLNYSLSKVDIVITTGGLGPTKDDVTKRAISEFLGSELVYDTGVLDYLEVRFREKLKRPMNQLNRDQALIPAVSKAIHNPLGTAPGILTETNGKLMFNLPGVPFEMKNLIKTEVIPILQNRFKLPFVWHKTISVSNYPESELATVLEDWENHLPSNIHLAYLPERGKVRLRLTCRGVLKEDLEKEAELEISKVTSLLGAHLDSLEEDLVEVILGNKLKEKGKSISTAESCTGGNLAQLLISVPGSSNYYKGSVVAYATEAKENVLGVPKELIEKYTVVSEKVAVAMAKGVREKLETDIAISTTGVAGPAKGEDGKEVGTAWIAVTDGENTLTKMFFFPYLEREDFIHQISKLALQNAFEFLK